MASIYKRGRIWWARVQVGGEDVRESLKTPSKEEAQRRFARWLDRVRRPGWAEDGPQSQTASGVMPRLLSPEEAARYCGIEIKDLVHLSVRPLEVVAGRFRYDRADLDRWIDGRKEQAAARSPARPH